VAQTHVVATSTSQDNEIHNVNDICNDIKIGFGIRIPRITNIQQYRANTKHNDPAEYYRINIFLPYLDYLISELNL